MQHRYDILRERKRDREARRHEGTLTLCLRTEICWWGKEDMKGNGKRRWGEKGRRIGEADKGVLEPLKKTELEEQKRRLAALNTYRATADWATQRQEEENWPVVSSRYEHPVEQSGQSLRSAGRSSEASSSSFILFNTTFFTPFESCGRSGASTIQL